MNYRLKTLLDALYYSVHIAMSHNQSFHANQLFTHAEEMRIMNDVSTDEINNYDMAYKAMHP